MIRFGPVLYPYPLTPLARANGVVPIKPNDPTANPSQTFSVIAQGDPIPQPRHRAGAFVVKNKATGQVFARPHVYLPENHPVHGYKRTIRELVTKALPAGWNLDVPIAVGCVFVFRRPVSAPGGKRGVRFPKTTKPDSDNLQKAIFDAVKTVVWRDDSQVAASLCTKIVGASHDEPHTVIVFDQRPGAILSGEWAARMVEELANAYHRN